MPDEAYVVAKKGITSMKDVIRSLKFMKAGAKEFVFFNPHKVKAAIVTCGGLCPGLNVVIREIFMTLHFNYEAPEVYGVQWGYKGFYTDVEKNWIKLDPQ